MQDANALQINLILILKTPHLDIMKLPKIQNFEIQMLLLLTFKLSRLHKLFNEALMERTLDQQDIFSRITQEYWFLKRLPLKVEYQW
jgi:hypothetical protein